MFLNDSPLGNPVFRLLWLAWFTAHLCMWMNDVGAGWIMSSVTDDPLLIALVQTASSLPIFFLGLPVGALADMVDRRRFFIFTQFWGAAVGVLFALAYVFGHLGPTLILLLVLANGVALALRWPVYSALMPTAVPREQLRGALALTSIAANSARIVGPLLAGVLIASAGPFWVFASNGVLCAITGTLLLRSKFRPPVSAAGRTALLPAMVAGLHYIRASVAVRLILVRALVFFMQGIVPVALMPLIARGLPGSGAETFGALLSAMGIGAVLGALFITRLARRFRSQTLLRSGRIMHAAAVLVVAHAPSVLIAFPAMVVTGVGWMMVGNTMTSSLQLRVPDQVRARVMSVYQMVIMGAAALGSALWGKVAGMTSLPTSLQLSVVVSLVLLLFTHRFVLPPAPATPSAG